MHPAVRIAFLLVTVAWLPFLSVPALFACAGGAAAAILAAPHDCRRATAIGIWRLRWLMAAILLLYLLFPAPEPVPMLVAEALARVFVLCVAVTTVYIALHGIPPGILVDALARVLAPLGRIGFATETFARRLSLTLAAVPRVQAMAGALPPANGPGRIARLAARAAAMVERIEREGADPGSGARIDSGRVPMLQWAWPLLPAVAGWLLFLAGGPR